MYAFAPRFDHDTEMSMIAHAPAAAANDNRNPASIPEYVARSRNNAGAAYQAPASKMWWLP